MFQNFEIAPSIESLPIPIRAQLLKDCFLRLHTILSVHCSGYLLIFYEDVENLYIRLRKLVREIIDSEGFENLKIAYPNSIPKSLQSGGKDMDIGWEFLENDIIGFQGAIYEFCIDHNASYGSKEGQEVFTKVLNSYDEYIKGFKEEKYQQEQAWLQKVEKTANKYLTKSNTENFFIHKGRIDEIKSIQSEQFDFTKLVRLCEEINICYSNNCYLAVAMLTRALVDHIPPIFGCRIFSDVYNNYKEGGKSFRESMLFLDKSLRKIADALLHTQIRKKEILPNKNQVDFSNSIDVLLAEIFRIFKK